ncbi:TetR/AcrR family transcriptional regulator [soil metagenome]
MTTDMREKIMGAGRRMVQAHGYSGLSFRELAKEVGVKSASIHYHFPAKADLGAALARRYTEDAVAYFDGLLESPGDAASRLRGYAGVYRAALTSDNRMCMVGFMAAEYDELPPEVRVEVDRFTDANVEFLMRALARRARERPDHLRARAMAVYAAVTGAQLIARGRGDIAVFDASIEAYRAAGLTP